MDYFHTVPFILHNNLQCKINVTRWSSSSSCTTVATYLYKNAKPHAGTFPSTTAEQWSMHKLFHNSYYICLCSLTKCQGLHENNHTINKIAEHTIHRFSNYTFNKSQKTVILHETYYTLLFLQSVWRKSWRVHYKIRNVRCHFCHIWPDGGQCQCSWSLPRVTCQQDI
jgi:hypothetical protein